MNAPHAPAIEDPAMAFAAVKMLTGSPTSPRLAMRGTSMLPLLREPMVLQLGPLDTNLRVGDILVFERFGRIVAHRVTALRNGKIQTCGDALPWSPEYPETSRILGKVTAVFENETPGAARVDGRLFLLRGRLNAHLRAARAIPCRFGRSLYRIAYDVYCRTLRPIIRRPK